MYMQRYLNRAVAKISQQALAACILCWASCMWCLTLSVIQHAELKLGLFACHASMTLSCHVQALDLQQNEFSLKLEAMTSAAANDRAALLATQRSVTHWHICHLPLLMAWSVCCLPRLTQHLKSPHTLLSLSCSALLKYG